MSLGRVWKISELSLSGFPQELLVGWPSTDALQEEVLTALPTLGKIEFVYTAMEKKKLEHVKFHGSEWRSLRSTNTLKRALVTESFNICAVPFCTSMSHWGGFRRVSIQATSNFICQLKWFSGTFRRGKMWHAGNDTWVSTVFVSRGRRSWDIPAVAAAQRAAPGKVAKAGLKICPFVCLCVCRPLWTTSRSSTTWELLS